MFERIDHAFQAIKTPDDLMRPSIHAISIYPLSVPCAVDSRWEFASLMPAADSRRSDRWPGQLETAGVGDKMNVKGSHKTDMIGPPRNESSFGADTF